MVPKDVLINTYFVAIDLMVLRAKQRKVFADLPEGLLTGGAFARAFSLHRRNSSATYPQYSNLLSSANMISD